MKEIKCPNCGEVFQVDESGYAAIVQQVRDSEFDKELSRRARELEQKQESDIRIIRMEKEKEQAAVLNKKEHELAEKDKEIAALRAKISASETEKMLAVTEARQEKD